MQAAILGKETQQGFVGDANILGIARERDPAKGPAPLAELRPDVSRHEARKIEGFLHARLHRLGADVVAVIEDMGAAPLKVQHGLHMTAHALDRARDIGFGIALSEQLRLLERYPGRHVTVELVVRARLIGYEIGLESHLEQAWKHLRRIADHADADRLPLGPITLDPLESILERVGDLVKVACLDTPACMKR